MILSVELLVALFAVEFALRLALEIRERRATMMRGGIFSVLRLIPLVNDIVPLPESRKEVPESEFVRKHEEGHRHFRHSVLRNIYKVAMLLVSVWVLAAMLVRGGLPLWQAVLWMHLVAIPFRALFHLYCWNQEYEADRYAFKELGKTKTKAAMHALAECEIPYTKLFAVMYREHPPVASRSKKLLNKEIRISGSR